MSEIISDFNEFKHEVLLEAEASAVLQADAFFELYSEAAIENGDIENVTPCAVLHEGSRRFRIDGYNLNKEQGELILVVCDFRSADELQKLNASDVESFFKQVERFYDRSQKSDFINALEDSSPTFEAGFLIYENRLQIKRLRIILFSNAVMSMRKKLATMREENGVRFSYSILDFERYAAIQASRSGSDPIEINFNENGLSPLPCLNASSGTDDYVSYLVVLPGKTLSDIYGLYGARLLEANVRTFLQARTKVNKGIINTLKDAPHNFFAFNNGLTATASEITTSTGKKGTFIDSVKNLQIVNGGQTTASILYARDKEKAVLENVYVQMKLSVVKPDAIEDIVPLISRYANTQNRISEADFFSSHPFHLHLEKLSRRISAPPKEGSLAGSKWFYERARGQYRDEQAYMTQGARKRFLAEYPRDQMLVKTDFAKYEMTFDGYPHIVSRGAQKCFMAYAARVEKKWNPEAIEYGDGFFRDAMCRALLFRWTDKMIGTSEWYKNDRGYKSQMVTYTLAILSEVIRQSESSLDYRKVWSTQSLPFSLRSTIQSLAPEVSQRIKDPPENVRNVAEFCKQQACWARLSGEFDSSLIEDMQDCLIGKEKAKDLKRSAKKERKIDSGIDAQKKVFELAEKWKSVLDFGQHKRLFSPKEIGVLDTCARIPNRVPTEKQCRIALIALDRAIEEGLKL